MADKDLLRREHGGELVVRYKETATPDVYTPYVELLTAATGGGPATIADGADVAQGTTTDTSAQNTALGRLSKLLVELQLKADLTETQPVSAASLPLPAGAATQATLASLLTELALKADLTETQPVSAASLPLPTGAATQATLASLLTELALKADLTEIQPVSAASLPLPTGAATEATLATRLAEATFTTRHPTVAQKTMAASMPVVIASDQSSVPVSGPLTDAQLRAATVPVSGTVAASVASTTLTATVTPAGDDVVADGRDVVAVAGTRVQMQGQACKVVAVTAETDNTGLIVIGAVTCVAAIATRRGLPLSAGDTATFTVDNVNRLYIDSTVSTDGVTWAILS